MKEQILTALYTVIKPWACDASDTHAYVASQNVLTAKRALKEHGLDHVVVIGRSIKDFTA